jgi:arginyl-tRNA synthetase
VSLESLWSRALAEAARRLWSIDLKPEELLEPTDPARGDCASSVAFKLAKQLKKAPAAIAGALADALAREKIEHLGRAEVAGPGYLNLSADRAYYEALARRILAEGAQFGRSVVGDGARVMVEFCSANPTGPLTVAHARQAVVGDVLCNALEYCGYDVCREYYVNDTGNQIRLLGESLLSRMPGSTRPLPPEGYHGEYVGDMAAALRDAQGDRFLTMDPETAIAELGRIGCAQLMQAIRDDLARFRVRFDHFTSQEQLEADGHVQRLLTEFAERDLLYEKDGARWLRSARFGDTEDKVLVKRDGTLTYRTTDLAYHREKFHRGYERLIDLWGPDHHAHVATMRAGLAAVGHADPAAFHVILVQHCRLFRGTEEVKMSKRAGTYTTLRELIDEVGVDAARYFFAMRRPDTPLDFDLELAKKQEKDNPVYYAQYAAVRVAGILRKGEELGLLDEAPPDLSLMGAAELDLLRRLRTFEHTVLKVAQLLDPSLLHQFIGEVAAAYQRYYELGNDDPALRVLCDDAPARRMRLAVSRAFQQVVSNALRLLGVSTPERM